MLSYWLRRRAIQFLPEWVPATQRCGMEELCGSFRRDTNRQRELECYFDKMDGFRVAERLMRRK